MKQTLRSIAAMVLPIMPFSAFAHPGHGETEGYTIIHYFTEPVHATVTVLGSVALIALYRYARRRQAGHKKA
jgi:hypothetical protein